MGISVGDRVGISVGIVVGAQVVALDFAIVPSGRKATAEMKTTRNCWTHCNDCFGVKFIVETRALEGDRGRTRKERE